MLNDCEVVSLGEIGKLKNGANFNKSQFGIGYPIINVTNLFDGRYASTSKLDQVRLGSIPNVEAVQVQRGDILFARSSVKASGVGQVAMVVNYHPNTIFSGFIIRFRVTETTRALPDYLNYLLRSDEYREILRRIATGTAIFNLSQGVLASLPVRLPPLEEQREIAHILGSLDDKIELNRQINATLEATARVIFKSWFVDFDPVHAKANGEQPVGMDADTAALFPASFEDSALGLVPAGWRGTPLDQIANFQNGLALQNFPPEDDQYLPVIKIRELRQGFVDTSSDKASPNIKESCIVYDGDVIFSWSGSLMIDLWCGSTGALNQHLFKVTSDTYPKWLCYLWTQHHLDEFIDIAANKATTMGHIQRHHLSSAMTVVPPDDALQMMGEVMEPLFDDLVNIRLQSRTLSELRDALLPKLIAGEFRLESLTNA